MRSLFKFLLFVATGLTALPSSAQNYTTTVTLNTLLSGGNPVPHAQVCAYVVDQYDNPLTVSAPTWGLILGGTGFCGTVTNGAISGGLPVPDANHTDSPVPVHYNFTVQILNSSLTPIGQIVTLSNVPNVSGPTYSLDSYSPAVSVPTPLSNTVAGGSGTPPSSCTSPSLWLSSTTTQAYICNAGTYVPFQTAPTTNPIAVTAEYAFNAGLGSSSITVPDLTNNGNTGTFCSGAAAPTWTADGLQFLTPTTTSALSVSSGYNCVSTPLTTFKSIAITFDTSAPYPSGTTAGYGSAAYGAALVGPAPSTSSGTQLISQVGEYAIGPQLVDASNGAYYGGSSQAAAGRHTLVVVQGSPNVFYMDGVQIPNNATSTETLSAVSFPGGMYFGTGAFGGYNGYKGKILYSTVDTVNAWTPAQVLAETNYIGAKIAVRALPPYSEKALAALRGPQIVVGGSSLNAGRSGTGTFSNYLVLNNSYTVTNSAVSGILMHDIDWDYNQMFAPYINTYGGTCYVVTDGGSNELATFNSSLWTLTPDTWSSVVDWAKKVRNSGCVPIYSTIIDRGPNTLLSGTIDATIASYNAIVRNGWRQAGIGALEDDAERPEFAPNNVTGNTTFYQTDNTHLTGGNACTAATGYGLRCVGLSRIINTLDGYNRDNPYATASNAFVASDMHVFTIQTPTAAATHQLVDCSFITGQQKTIVNGSASYAITVGTTNSQTIVGSTTIAALATGVFTAEVLAGNAGGCYWMRVQ